MKHYSPLDDALSGALFGLPPIANEQRGLIAASLASANCKSLARIIAELLNEHEPLLKAESSDATVTVKERGGSAVMSFTINSRETRNAQQAAGDKQ